MDVKSLFELTKKIFIFAFSVFLIYIGLKISVFYIPFLVAFVLAQLIEPLIRFCMNTLKMRRRISAIIIFAILLSAIIGLIVWGAVTLITEATNFLNNFNQYYEKVSGMTQNMITNFNFDKIQVSEEVRTFLNNASTQAIRSRFELDKRYNYKNIRRYNVNSICSH